MFYLFTSTLSDILGKDIPIFVSFPLLPKHFLNSAFHFILPTYNLSIHLQIQRLLIV